MVNKNPTKIPLFSSGKNIDDMSSIILVSMFVVCCVLFETEVGICVLKLNLKCVLLFCYVYFNQAKIQSFQSCWKVQVHLT